jgi:hypothetical protein
MPAARTSPILDALPKNMGFSVKKSAATLLRRMLLLFKNNFEKKKNAKKITMKQVKR